MSIDNDRDGVITVEDVIKYFGPEDKIDYSDLLRLIKEKDSTHKGKLSYTDFSRWLGHAIH